MRSLGSARLRRARRLAQPRVANDRGSRLRWSPTSHGIGVAVVIGLSWDQIAERYRFWSMFESLGKNEQGMPEYRHRQMRYCCR